MLFKKKTVNEVRGLLQPVEWEKLPVTQAEMSKLYARLGAIEKHLGIIVSENYEKYTVKKIGSMGSGLSSSENGCCGTTQSN